MTDEQASNFGATGPVEEYDARVRRMNPGYDLAFDLVVALLRATGADDAHLLLIGGGGSTEVRAYWTAHPGWRLTVVDPTGEMIELARTASTRHGLGDRVTFVHGTLDSLPAGARFDAATLCYVLMHLPDNGAKLRLLRSIIDRLKPSAPLILIDSVHDHRARLEGAWRAYALSRGAAPEALDAFFERITTRGNAVTGERNLELLREAGFREITPFFTAFTMNGWIAGR